jgi:hypothetical protein
MKVNLFLVKIEVKNILSNNAYKIAFLYFLLADLITISTYKNFFKNNININIINTKIIEDIWNIFSLFIISII